MPPGQMLVDCPLYPWARLRLAAFMAVVLLAPAHLRSQDPALPPFDLTYDLKLHWHRRFDNEPRSIWLREQLAAVFRDLQWLPAPTGPAPFLES